MPLRLVITKATGQGEQCQIDVPQWDPVKGGQVHTIEEMQALFDEACKFVDLRTTDMNIRMLEAYQLEEWCTPEVWSKVVDICDIFASRQTADLVRRRWQSAIEETAELEAARQAARDQALIDTTQQHELDTDKQQDGQCTCDHYLIPCTIHGS